MNFYVSVFKNSRVVSVTRYGEAGPGPKGTVMSATFQLEGQDFYALNGGPQFTFTPAVSFFVNCETQQEVDELWEQTQVSVRSADLRRRWETRNFGSKLLFLLRERPREVEHYPAPFCRECLARFRSERRGGDLLDFFGHLEKREAFAAPLHQGSGDPARSHPVDLHRVVRDLLLGSGGTRIEARQAPEESLDRLARDAEGGEKHLRAAAMPHPRDPALLAREDRQEVEEVAIQIGTSGRDPLGRRGDAMGVAEGSDAVQARGQGPNVLLDPPTRRQVHRGIVKR